MRVPLSWLRELVDLPATEDAYAVAERLTAAGLVVETVDTFGADLRGPVVVGQVLDVEELTGLRKPIRYCHVGVGRGETRGVICGAMNFAAGDKVVVALPGAVLPGGLAIDATQKYGRTSDGMICSARELGMGQDATGILVLPGDAPVGEDAVGLLGLCDQVLDIAVNPDRGYALSLRGVAREAATAYAMPFADPAILSDAAHPSDAASAGAPGYPVRVADPAACPLFVAATVTGADPAAPSPLFVQRRLQLAGMRPISLVVDVTNYVMLELGQPLHAYDRVALQGAIVVRRAQEGERLETLDGVKRQLDPEDLLITDASGPIGIAGVMGGANTEISVTTTDIVLEAAHFDPVTVARAARRHKLPSEASRRFERGVDPALPPVAARRAGELLVAHGGGRIQPDVTVVGQPGSPRPIRISVDLPARVCGYPYPPDAVVGHLEAVGCRVVENGAPSDLTVTPPTWRPDLVDPYDLVEEVARLHGYDAIPSVLPQAPAGRGLTAPQRTRRRVGRALAAAGYVEAPNYPFVGPRDWEALGIPDDDARRRTTRLTNPLSDEQPELRSTLLPGLLTALRRNVSRGNVDPALFEIGLVFLPDGRTRTTPRLPVHHRPTEAQLAALEAALPDQPWHVAAALAGEREPRGWWGPGRPAVWADAVEAAREVGRATGVALTVRAGHAPPWHPGRCAEVLCDGSGIGFAGELHPRAVTAYGLPPRTAAMELDLRPLLTPSGPVPAPVVSPYPVATQDVALVVAGDVPAAAVQEALAAGAGPLLESVRLFDVYTGAQVGPGRRSLAFALRFRAPDRTLTVEEATTARDAAVAEAARRTGAVLRGA
jgi:phenylalanyl-tRNA synthetase beta chain